MLQKINLPKRIAESGMSKKAKVVSLVAFGLAYWFIPLDGEILALVVPFILPFAYLDDALIIAYCIYWIIKVLAADSNKASKKIITTE